MNGDERQTNNNMQMTIDIQKKEIDYVIFFYNNKKDK